MPVVLGFPHAPQRHRHPRPRGPGRPADAQPARRAQHARLCDGRRARRRLRCPRPATTPSASSSLPVPESTSWPAATSAPSTATLGRPPAERHALLENVVDRIHYAIETFHRMRRAGRRARPGRGGGLRSVDDLRVRPRDRRRRRVLRRGLPPDRAVAGRRHVVVAAATGRRAPRSRDPAAGRALRRAGGAGDGTRQSRGARGRSRRRRRQGRRVDRRRPARRAEAHQAPGARIADVDACPSSCAPRR